MIEASRTESDIARSPAPRQPFAIGLALLAIAAILLGMYRIRDVLLISFFAVLLATVMSLPIDWLSRRMARGLAVLLTLIAMLGIGALLVGTTVPIVVHQAKEASHAIPGARSRFEDWYARIVQRSSMAKGIDVPKRIEQSVQKNANQAVGTVVSETIPALTATVEGLTSLVFVFVLAAFLVYNPRNYRDAARTLVPRRHEAAFNELWSRVGSDLRRWLGGILLSMTIMGSLTAIGIWIVGLKEWPLLGALTFFGTFVPYVGAIASSVPGLILGLAQSGTTFFHVGLVYVGVHVVEGYVVSPFIMRRAVEIRPAFLLFWQVAMGALFGILGIAVATPLLVCLRSIVRYLYIERRLGKDAEAARPRGFRRARGEGARAA